MMNNQLIAVPVRFGSIAGALTIVLFLVLYSMEVNPLVEARVVDLVLIPMFLYFGLKDFRDYRNGGILHYWQGMTAGVIIYLLMALMSSIWIITFLEFIDPDLLSNYILDRAELLDGSKLQIVEQMGEQTFLESKDEIQRITSFDLALDDFLKKSIIGLMLTIMISVILRKKPA
ncbi:MAG: DUF4199 domain-containing protein [Cyclobacteriaceae bacterium]